MISDSASPAALNHVSGSMPEYMSANSGRSRASRTDGLAGGALPTAPRSAGFMLLVLTLRDPAASYNPDYRPPGERASGQRRH